MSEIMRKRLLRHKGRLGGDVKPYAYLPVELLKSDAVRTLPHLAHRAMVALAAQYSGHGNGSLTLTPRIAAEHGIGGTHPLRDALRELEGRGLIIVTRPGSRLPPRSAMYALTWWKIDEALDHDPHDVTPTLYAPDTWRHWTAEKSGIYWVTEGARLRSRRKKRKERLEKSRYDPGSHLCVTRGHTEWSDSMTLGHTEDAISV